MSMKNLIRTRIAPALGALTLAVTPAAALAGTAWYDGSDPGANYSWDLYNDNTAIRVHDGECDGDGGYAHYYTTSAAGTQRRINDPDGCSSQEGTATGLQTLQRHRTCEDHQFSPDPCSGYNWE